MDPFELTFAYGVKQGFSFILLPSGYPVFPAPFVEKSTFYPLNGLGALVKNHLTIYARVYFWTLYSIPFVYRSEFMPVAHCFDYSSFVVRFEIRKCLQICSSFSGLFWLFRVP